MDPLALTADDLAAMLPPFFSSIEMVARGGQGVVFRAIRDGEPVAIKVLPADSSDALRLELEFSRLAALGHPSVARPLEVLHLEGFAAMVMEWIEGVTLAEYLRTRWLDIHTPSGLPPNEAFALVKRILKVLADLLALDPPVIHCDIKPSNVILRNGSPEDPVLVDFGAIREVLTTSRHTSTVLGTPGYIAPEYLQARRISARADVYSVGSLLAELISGRGPDLDAALRALEAEPVWHSFLEIARRADPSARFADAREALAFLESPSVRSRWRIRDLARHLTPIHALVPAGILAAVLTAAAVIPVSVEGGPQAPSSHPVINMGTARWLSGRSLLGLERWRWRPADDHPVGSWAAGRTTVLALGHPGYIAVAAGRASQLVAVLDRRSGAVVRQGTVPFVPFRPHWNRTIARSPFDGYLAYSRVQRAACRFGDADVFIVNHGVWYPASLRIEGSGTAEQVVNHPGKIVDARPWRGPDGRERLLVLAVNNMWGHLPAIFAISPSTGAGMLMGDGLYENRGQDVLVPLFYTLLPDQTIGDLQILAATPDRIVVAVNGRRIDLDGHGRPPGTDVDPSATARQLRTIQAALAARAAGDVSHAVEILERTTAMPNTDPALRAGAELVLARWAVLLGDTPVAADHCRRALSIVPGMADAALWLSELQALAGTPSDPSLVLSTRSVDWQVMIDLALANVAAGFPARARTFSQAAGRMGELERVYLQACRDPASFADGPLPGPAWYFLPHLIRARALLAADTRLSVALEEIELAGTLAEPYDMFALETTRALILEHLGRGDEIVMEAVQEELRRLEAVSHTRPLARFEQPWALDHAARLAAMTGSETRAVRLAAEAARRAQGLVPAAARDARDLLGSLSPVRPDDHG